MSASQTTVPAAKAKLRELFKATVDETTEVWSNRPNEDHQLAENIYIGGVSGQRKFMVLSAIVQPNSRQEDYSITVEVEVYREGTDVDGTEARMWEIAQQCELAVAEHRTLDNLNNSQWAIASQFRQATTAGTDGVLANYTFGVAVKARI